MNPDKEIASKDKGCELKIQDNILSANHLSDVSKNIVLDIIAEAKDILINKISSEKTNIDESLLIITKELVYASLYLIEDVSILIGPCQRSSIINEFKRGFCTSLYESLFTDKSLCAENLEYFYTIFEEEYVGFKKERALFLPDKASNQQIIDFLIDELLTLDIFSPLSLELKEDLGKKIADFLKKKVLSQISLILFS